MKAISLKIKLFLNITAAGIFTSLYFLLPVDLKGKDLKRSKNESVKHYRMISILNYEYLE